MLVYCNKGNFGIFPICNIFWYPVKKTYFINIIFYDSLQSISPGFVDTEIFDAAKMSHNKMKPSDVLSAEEMADMICFVMSTGPNILVNNLKLCIRYIACIQTLPMDVDT